MFRLFVFSLVAVLVMAGPATLVKRQDDLTIGSPAETTESTNTTTETTEASTTEATETTETPTETTEASTTEATETTETPTETTEASTTEATETTETPTETTVASTTAGAETTEGPEDEEGGSFERTVIFLKKSTSIGQEVFIRGGVGGASGCTHTSDAELDPCAIPIEHSDLELNADTPSRDGYAVGDNYLSWADRENTQNTAAMGTPAQWTTSDQSEDYFYDINTFGADYWLVEVDMDCSILEDGFFEFKGIMNDGVWENDIPSSNCDGDGAQSADFYSANHVGRCGYINVFEWGSPRCSITSFSE